MGFLDPREPVNTWSHGLWLILALLGTVLLWCRSGGQRGKQISLLIYGLSLVFCATTSTLYHGVRTSVNHIAQFALFDHIAIYFLIAGSYTAIGWTLLRGRWRQGILAMVWLWALAGTALRLSGIDLPSWLSTALYLAMGWGSVIGVVELSRRLPYRALFPIALGGLLYSVGAVVNLLSRPVLWPGVFRAHELFHLFVMAGSLVHFHFVLKVVVPFGHEPGMSAGDPGSCAPPSATSPPCPPGRIGGSRQGLI